MKKIIFVIFFLSHSLCAKQHVARLYFNHIMGHVHKNPSDYSSSLTTIQCAHSVKVIENVEALPPEGWLYVKVGEDFGYVRRDYLQDKRPNCFQAKYPKFFNALNLDITDMYYWGRLYDQYKVEESSAQ